MGKFTTEVNKKIRDNRGKRNASLAYETWYSRTFANNRNNTVYRIGVTDIFQLGKMYKFDYHPITPIEKLKWYDRSPLILSLGREWYNGSILETGINLHMLPFNTRIFLLDKITSAYNLLIESQSNGLHSNNAYKQIPLNFNWNSIGYLVNKLKLGYSYRKYKVTAKRNSAVISYENWDRMAIIDRDQFTNSSRIKVSRDYHKYIQKKNKQK